MSTAPELNHCAALQQAMAEAGLVIQSLPIDDGQLHRFRVAGDKAGSENGWYVLYPGEVAAGAFGCWKRAINENWCSQQRASMMPDQRQQFEAQLLEARQQREEEQQARHKAAAEKSLQLWNTARPSVDANHPYLKAKQIRPYGLRQLQEQLLIPMRDERGQLASLQFIAAGGGKKFKTGGRKKGCYCSIGKLTDPLYLCEGYATGATIHQLTGCGVAVTFDAGNLLAVAKVLLAKNPNLNLVIAADNDHQAEHNTGMMKARQAALQTGIAMTHPVFSPDDIGSDFNDLAALKGPDVTRAALACYQLVGSAEPGQEPPPEAETGDQPEYQNPIKTYFENGAAEATETPEIQTQQGAQADLESSPDKTAIPLIPGNWMLAKDGVYQLLESDDKPPVKISGRVWIEAMTRDVHGGGWGSVTCWEDRDGKRRERAIPQSRFHEMGNTLAQELAAEGLAIIPGKERRLAAYLGAFEPDQRIRAVESLGWLGDKHGQLSFVLPNRVISRSAEACVFQPEQYSPTVRTMKQSNTLEQWQQNVAIHCDGNPILLFGLCAAFAGPMIKPAGMDSGGFHIWGRSSGGKTTTGQVVASVWGCGADPADAPDQSYIRRWNATANASEALAAAHNDNILIMDELGTCSVKDFGALTYNLMGGQGKAALRSDRSMRASRSWRILVLSTGEVSAKAKIEENGKSAKGGQLLRLIDICIPHGSVIQDTHGQTPSSFAEQLKRNCADYYGVAGPAFLERLVDNATSGQELRTITRQLIQSSAALLTPDNIEQEQRRAIQRFALVQAAGLLASRLGILPQQPEAIQQAISDVLAIWLGDHRGISDSARAISSVREFILTHGSRFRDSNDNTGQRVNNLAGYRDQVRNLWLFTDSGFKEACAGHDQKEVARELTAIGLLFKNEGDRQKSKHTIEGMGRISLYGVKGELLNDSSD